MLTVMLLTSVVAGALALVPGAAAQGDTCDNPRIGCCGDLTLVLRNPGLLPTGSDPFIRAQGQMFIQFQAIGDEADKIETIGFSFGAYTADVPENVCELPSEAWFTGQQVPNYRADTDPSDGFFINLITPIVPDGQYTASISAYDGNDQELARFWAAAIVNNCDGSGQEFCRDDTEQHLRNDETKPWPIVLPGDGEAPGNQALTIEFGEPIAELKVFLNSEDITDELEPWEGREWDADYFPGYGPRGLSAILVAECQQQPPQTCQPFGESYQWNGRELTDDDVLRIEATDLAGNLGIKDIHVGSGVTGGAVSAKIPLLSWEVDEIQKTAKPGESALFRFTIRNDGGETGHPFADQEIPAGWDFEWNPPHVPVASGTSEPQELQVMVPANATAGTYDVVAYMDYEQAGEPKKLQQLLRVVVDTPNEADDSDADPDVDAESKGSPAPLLPGVVGLAGLAIALRRRD